MNTTVRFLLAAIVLLVMFYHAHADSANIQVEVSRDEVVLEAGEIDSSTAKIARDITQTGYGHAVDRLGETPDTAFWKNGEMELQGDRRADCQQASRWCFIGLRWSLPLGQLGCYRLL